MPERIFIKSACQISCQSPLSEEWIDSPAIVSGHYLRSQDPKFSDFIPPMQARRMGLLLKRAVVTSQVALEKAGITLPDAIITGTALGCMENTEKFLGKICREGEQMLSPTDFMQSTHNTISSLIAIRLHANGYNCTYSHGESSFGSALLDAAVQMRLGKIRNALVGCHDETTEETFRILTHAGYFSEGDAPATELSVSMVLSTDSEGALCELRQVKVINASGRSTGEICREALAKSGFADFRGEVKILTDAECSQLFGKNLSLPAAGVYAGAQMVGSGKCPVAVVVGGSCGDERTVVVLSEKGLESC